MEWQRLRRRTNIQSHEELELCLSEVVNNWAKTPQEEKICGDELKINNNNNKNNNNNNFVSDRESLKYTVKVFPSISAEPEVVRDAVEKLMSELGVDFVDVIIIGFEFQN